MPASDVPAWAKAAIKPSYTANEVGAASSTHTHSNYATTTHTHDNRYYTEAEIDAKFNSFSVPNLHVYFEDTSASSLIGCFSAKCLSVRSKGDGLFALYGGWSGHDFGLFIGQVCNGNVTGLFFNSDSLYKVLMNAGTTTCSYTEFSHGSNIS